MSVDDAESQENELLVLESIFDKRQFIRSNENVGGQFYIMIDLPNHFQVSYSIRKDGKEKISDLGEQQVPDVDGMEQTIDVNYLPPILMNFMLPSMYPSQLSPTFTLSCKWLTPLQLSTLCHGLDNLWNEQDFHSEILYEWVQYLNENTLTVLNITSPFALNVERNQQNDSRAIQDVESVDSLLEYLLDFDVKETQFQFSINYFNCNVCFEEKPGNLCVIFHQCKHVYCSNCMTDYFLIQITDGSVRSLTCPEAKCETQADPSLVKTLVDEETYEKYDRFLLQSALDCMNDIVYCPRCQTPVLKETDETMGICPSCKYSFCTLCKRCYHGISKCPVNSKELLKLREQYLAATDDEKLALEKRYGRKVLKNAVEELYSESWLSQFTQTCPSCNTKIEKIDGCNKMTCFKCTNNFCWICNKLISSSDPYAHYQNNANACYNKLFEGIVVDDLDDSDDEDGWVNLVDRLQ